ncbi:hypothetical protein I3842_11G078800 [Carya illinoinensis]|uniref:Uncharacterized protein n=1 Tax=Carya illinoinensis TaxID=32201 RepID=A0A922IYF0_CARIL|nr:hypothetical protein I3842_11G078800 [Carya illinoinensis]
MRRPSLFPLDQSNLAPTASVQPKPKFQPLQRFLKKHTAIKTTPFYISPKPPSRLYFLPRSPLASATPPPIPQSLKPMQTTDSHPTLCRRLSCNLLSHTTPQPRPLASSTILHRPRKQAERLTARHSSSVVAVAAAPPDQDHAAETLHGEIVATRHTASPTASSPPLGLHLVFDFKFDSCTEHYIGDTDKTSHLLTAVFPLEST